MQTLGKPIDKANQIPVHLQVRDRLLSLILEGELTPGSKLLSEPEIALTLGVSRMTANKSILSLVADGWLVRAKGRGTYVTDRLPTDQDRFNLKRLVRRIAIAVETDPDGLVNDFYFGALYWGVHHALYELGYSVEIVRIPGALIEATKGCQGIIAIAPSLGSLEGLVKVHNRGGNLVVLGSEWRDYKLNQIDSDNLLGSALVVNHLVDLGHQRILFFGGEPQNSNTLDRARGFQTAMKARGLACDDSTTWVIPRSHILSGEDKLRLSNLLQSPNRPTAIFAAGPKLAVGVLSVAYSLGLRVPEQLSLVAYDDPEFIHLAYPPLTTVRQPLSKMADAACRCLLNLVENGPPAREVTEVFDPELIVRASTSSPCAVPPGSW